MIPIVEARNESATSLKRGSICITMIDPIYSTSAPKGQPPKCSDGF